jgi:hypothetical protein
MPTQGVQVHQGFLLFQPPRAAQMADRRERTDRALQAKARTVSSELSADREHQARTLEMAGLEAPVLTREI